MLHWPNERLPLAETIDVLCKAKRDGRSLSHRRLRIQRRRLEEAVRVSVEPLVWNQFECIPSLLSVRR